MVRILSLLVVVIFAFTGVAARHIKGGWIRYEYLGAGSSLNSSSYRITVNLFVSCTENGPTDQVYIGIFDAVTNATIKSQLVLTSNNSTITKTSYDPCLNNPPTVCYRIYNYITTVELPNNTNGYIIAVQDALRSANVVNVVNSSSSGITFTATIPGTINLVDLHSNSSPFFDFKDTVIICYNAPFTYQFSASDPDNDSLSYYLGNGLDVAGAGGNTSSSPPAAPPYFSVNYSGGFSGSSPLGSSVIINEKTGLISGTAPAATGEYVLAVYVKEFRNGVLIATTKKELQIAVANCSLTAASLKASYINCDDFSFTFRNESSSSNVNAYMWDFGVPGINTDVSTQPTPTYVYPDTGTYLLKLKVVTSASCADSATAAVRVYPGFSAGFTVAGGCYASPFYFKDTTAARYGTVNAWLWDFGDMATFEDTSSQKNPVYKYPDAGTRTAVLTVASSKGCSSTVSKSVIVNNKPFIELPFRDTLICSIDTLSLIANSTGTFSWSPAINIINANTSTPSVFPKNTVTYRVTVSEADCLNTDSITVNVLDFITVDAGRDTSICRTDSIKLQPVSQALSFAWQPSTALSNPNAISPDAAPQTDITYYVTANLGKCQDRDSIRIRVSPYPQANAGSDTAICYGDEAQLHGTIAGAFFNWNPVATLRNAGSLTPLALPLSTTAYILTVRDTLACPKAVYDTVVVNIIPPIQVYAGRDTNIVRNEPLQLLATGATTFSWTPTTGLDNANIANPVVTISSSMDSIRYTVTSYSPEGCRGTDDIVLRIFKTGAEIFVPSAFTPNGDGKNEMLKPILVGIRSLSYLRIYNRFGQLVFASSNADYGWNGKLNGSLQPSGAFVYVAAGIDYLGNVIRRKGTVVLIR